MVRGRAPCSMAPAWCTPSGAKARGSRDASCFSTAMKDRVIELVARLIAAFPNCRFGLADGWHPRFDMIVNASPIGVYGKDAMPGKIGPLSPGTIVGDVVLSEQPTGLIQHASDHHCLSVTGREMHAGQMDAILQFFGFDT